jgi:phosphoglycerate dehydrogenase-like enzyme
VNRQDAARGVGNAARVKPNVAVLDDYQQVARTFGDWDRLSARADVSVFSDHLADEDALVERLLPFAAIVLMRERTPFPRSLLARLPNLKLLATSGMWNAAIDLVACEEHGVTVCGTQVGGGGTAQLTWALILALAQQITTVDRDIREGRWQTGLGEELAGKTLGLLGLGRIGANVARAAQAFDMHVLAWSANLTDERAAAAGAERVERDELLRRSDVVSVHLVLSARTRGLLGRRELALLKPTAFLVNTSRGPIVDEAALIEVLEERRIAGAGLDVFDAEPLPLDHPLRRLPNTVLTPHIGYVSRESYAVVYPQLLEDVEAWLDGAPIRRMLSTVVPEKSAYAPGRR